MNNVSDPRHPFGSDSSNIPVSAPAEPQALPPPRPPIALRRPRHRPCRLIDLNALCPGESVGDVEHLTGDGDFITLPNCLTSPRWSLSCIPAQVAENLGWPIHFFPGDHVRHYATPYGRIPMIRCVLVLFRLLGLTDNFSWMWFPILETETYGNLGVSMIIGEAHIRRNAFLSRGSPLGHYVPPQHGESRGNMPFAHANNEHDVIHRWLTDAYDFQWDEADGVARGASDQNPAG